MGVAYHGASSGASSPLRSLLVLRVCRRAGFLFVTHHGNVSGAVDGGRVTPDRLARPLKRSAGGTFETLSWDQAAAEIAARLVISERTASTHISNILGKLHLASRTQAALYALKQGLTPPGAT